MHHQPLLVVLRAEQPLQLEPQLQALAASGVRHVEIAWSGHPAWQDQCRRLGERFPDLKLGAASLVTGEAVRAAAAAGLGYGVSPVLDGRLWQQACQLGFALVPGVFTPSEVHQARNLGCRLVKLFPAASVGPGYWSRLRAPLGPLPCCIAAGGLAPRDVMPWLEAEAGVDAVALGGSLHRSGALDALAGLVQRLAHRPAARPARPDSA